MRACTRPTAVYPQEGVSINSGNEPPRNVGFVRRLTGTHAHPRQHPRPPTPAPTPTPTPAHAQCVAHPRQHPRTPTPAHAHRIRSICKDCGGASICAHYRVRSKCQECKRRRGELVAASTAALRRSHQQTERRQAGQENQGGRKGRAAGGPDTAQTKVLIRLSFDKPHLLTRRQKHITVAALRAVGCAVVRGGSGRVVMENAHFFTKWASRSGQAQNHWPRSRSSRARCDVVSTMTSRAYCCARGMFRRCPPSRCSLCLSLLQSPVGLPGVE